MPHNPNPVEGNENQSATNNNINTNALLQAVYHQAEVNSDEGKDLTTSPMHLEDDDQESASEKSETAGENSDNHNSTSFLTKFLQICNLDMSRFDSGKMPINSFTALDMVWLFQAACMVFSFYEAYESKKGYISGTHLEVPCLVNKNITSSDAEQQAESDQFYPFVVNTILETSIIKAMTNPNHEAFIPIWVVFSLPSLCFFMRGILAYNGLLDKDAQNPNSAWMKRLYNFNKWLDNYAWNLFFIASFFGLAGIFISNQIQIAQLYRSLETSDYSSSVNVTAPFFGTNPWGVNDSEVTFYRDAYQQAQKILEEVIENSSYSQANMTALDMGVISSGLQSNITSAENLLRTMKEGEEDQENLVQAIYNFAYALSPSDLFSSMSGDRPYHDFLNAIVYGGSAFTFTILLSAISLSYGKQSISGVFDRIPWKFLSYIFVFLGFFSKTPSLMYYYYGHLSESYNEEKQYLINGLTYFLDPLYKAWINNYSKITAIFLTLMDMVNDKDIKFTRQLFNVIAIAIVGISYLIIALSLSKYPNFFEKFFFIPYPLLLSIIPFTVYLASQSDMIKAALDVLFSGNDSTCLDFNLANMQNAFIEMITRIFSFNNNPALLSLMCITVGLILIRFMVQVVQACFQCCEKKEKIDVREDQEGDEKAVLQGKQQTFSYDHLNGVKDDAVDPVNNPLHSNSLLTPRHKSHSIYIAERSHEQYSITSHKKSFNTLRQNTRLNRSNEEKELTETPYGEKDDKTQEIQKKQGVSSLSRNNQATQTSIKEDLDFLEGSHTTNVIDDGDHGSPFDDLIIRSSHNFSGNQNYGKALLDACYDTSQIFVHKEQSLVNFDNVDSPNLSVDESKLPTCNNNEKKIEDLSTNNSQVFFRTSSGDIGAVAPFSGELPTQEYKK